VIYTDPPLVRYAIVDGEPVIETSTWAYVPGGHDRAIPLPDEIFKIYAASIVAAADLLNESLWSQFEMDLEVWNRDQNFPRPVKPDAHHPENLWVPFDISPWLFDGDPSENLDIFTMKPRKGVKFVTESEYQALVVETQSKSQSAIDKLNEALVYRTSEYEKSAAIYKKLGLSQEEIERLIGSYPSNE
jgi:hypothetical protein